MYKGVTNLPTRHRINNKMPIKAANYIALYSPKPLSRNTDVTGLGVGGGC